MKNKYTFLRHAETIKDSNKASIDWDLTPDALIQISEYLSSDKFKNITKIYSSTEPKAIATLKPIAQKLGLEINTLENFVEVKREKKFLTEAEFIDQKRRELTNLDQIENGVESGSAALARFMTGINILEEKYSDHEKVENILICSHGTILTIYFATLLKQEENIFERFKKIKFCAAGEVESGKVVVDIASLD